MVIDTDGSAFITKAEFDSLKNNFQAQIDNYNQSIDSKIDGAIAAYLAGIKIDSGETGLGLEWITDWKNSVAAGKMGKMVDLFVGGVSETDGFPSAGQMYVVSGGIDPATGAENIICAYANKSVGSELISGSVRYYTNYVKMDELKNGLFIMNGSNNTISQGGLAFLKADPQTLVQGKASWAIGSAWEWLGTWGKGNYGRTSASYDMIDGRYVGLVPWPVYIQYKNIYGNWPSNNKRTFLPLIKISSGYGKMIFRWQVDYVNSGDHFKPLVGTSVSGFDDNTSIAYFAVYNSFGEEVKKIFDGTTEVDNIWKAGDKGSWYESPELDVREGDYLGLVVSPRHTGSTSLTYMYIFNGTIYMNFINLNP